MSILEKYQHLGVADAARQLELHPFEVVRILVADGSLPAELRLDAAQLARVRAAGGLQTWWDGPAEPLAGEREERAGIRALLRKMIEQGAVEPKAARADNLFRGLDADRQHRLRGSVNSLIQHGILFSHMTATGLTIGVRAGELDEARAFAFDGTGRIDRLWDLD